MLFYAIPSSTDAPHEQRKVWQVVEKGKGGWCRLQWTHTIWGDIVEIREDVNYDDPSEHYIGRFVKFNINEGLIAHTVRIRVEPVGVKVEGSPTWEITMFGEKIEDLF